MLVILSAPFVVGPCFAIAHSIPKARNESRGPRPFTEAELLKLSAGGELPSDLVAFDAPAMTDTGIFTTYRGGVGHRYKLVTVGGQRALASVPSDQSDNHLVGYVERLDGLTGLDGQAREQVVKKFPNQPLAPYFFKVTGGRPIGWILIAMSSLLFLAGMRFLLAGLFRW